MKTKLIFSSLLLIFITCLLNAQVVTVVNELGTPGKLVKQNDIIYFTELAVPNPNTTGPIGQYNISTGVKSSFLTGIEQPWPIIFNETDFYVAEFFNGLIYKGEISDPNGTLEQFPLGFTDVSDINLIGDHLYVLSQSQGNLYKFDVTSINPVSELVLSSLNDPYDLYLRGDELFIVESFGNRVSKIDITASNPVRTTVVDGLNEPDSIVIVGDIAYITEYQLGEVVRVDLTDPNLTLETVVDGLQGPTGIIADGSDIYITETVGNKISKFNIEEVLAVTNENTAAAVSIFPNPATNEIKISGLSNTENYHVFDSIGKKVKSGNVSNMDVISIKELSNGVYFIKIEIDNNAFVRKFIKR